MLGFWRRQSKVMTYLIFGAIIFVFIIWGFERSQRSLSSGMAAEVNNHVITVREYRRELNRRVQMYTQMFGGKFEGDLIKQFNLPMQTIQSMVNTEVAIQGAEHSGIGTSDEELRETIVKFPWLQRDGRFSREQYDAVLRANNLTAQDFEEEIRRESTLQKAEKLFNQALTTAPSEKAKAETLKSKTMNLEFVRLNPEALAKEVKISDQQVNDFLANESNKKHAKDYVDSHREQFSQEARVKARHILVKAEGANTDAALKKIHEIQKELKNSSFEALAKKYSDDPGSKNKGGDLGWFSRGKMVPEFEDEAFKLKVGEISRPIKTSYGYHLIKIEGKEDAKATSPEAALKQAARSLLAREKVDQDLAQFAKAWESNPEAAVADLQKRYPGLKWEDTGVFSLADEHIPKIGDSEDLQAALSDLGEKKRFASKLVSEPTGSRVALRFKSSGEQKAKEEKSVAKMDQPDNQGREVFTTWVQILRKEAKVKPNERLLSQSADMGAD